LLIKDLQISGDGDHDWMTLLCSYCGHKIKVPVYCGNRFCPICCVPRNKRVRLRLKWILSHIQKRRTAGIKHLTLTIRSESDLPAMIKHIMKAFRRLRQTKYWKHSVFGGAYIVEITGRPGNWHAHIHAAIHSYWMDWHKILRMWKQVSDGQGVYIQAIPVKATINHLLKYLSKGAEPTQVELLKAQALKHVRLFQPFGEWHAVNSTYVKPTYKCTECGQASFLPDFMLYSAYSNGYSHACEHAAEDVEKADGIGSHGNSLPSTVHT